MTSNQIAYWKYLEDKRHNEVSEKFSKVQAESSLLSAQASYLHGQSSLISAGASVTNAQANWLNATVNDYLKDSVEFRNYSVDIDNAGVGLLVNPHASTQYGAIEANTAQLINQGMTAYHKVKDAVSKKVNDTWKGLVPTTSSPLPAGSGSPAIDFDY